MWSIAVRPATKSSTYTSECETILTVNGVGITSVLICFLLIALLSLQQCNLLILMKINQNELVLIPMKHHTVRCYIQLSVERLINKGNKPTCMPAVVMCCPVRPVVDPVGCLVLYIFCSTCYVSSLPFQSASQFLFFIV